jgi:CheY-like chemotaxis protein
MSAQKVILLAEDSEEDQIAFQRVLEKSGVANPVVKVSDGDIAISYLKGEPPHDDREKNPLPAVLFLDLKMPRCDGFAVLQWLKEQPHLDQMLVVVLSGLESTEEIRRAYELRSVTFLSKPFTPGNMLNLVSSFDGFWIRKEPAPNMKPWQHLSSGPG